MSGEERRTDVLDEVGQLVRGDHDQVEQVRRIQRSGRRLGHAAAGAVVGDRGDRHAGCLERGLHAARGDTQAQLARQVADQVDPERPRLADRRDLRARTRAGLAAARATTVPRRVRGPTSTAPCGPGPTTSPPGTRRAGPGAPAISRSACTEMAVGPVGIRRGQQVEVGAHLAAARTGWMAAARRSPGCRPADRGTTGGARRSRARQAPRPARRPPAASRPRRSDAAAPRSSSRRAGDALTWRRGSAPSGANHHGRRGSRPARSTRRSGPPAATTTRSPSRSRSISSTVEAESRNDGSATAVDGGADRQLAPQLPHRSVHRRGQEVRASGAPPGEQLGVASTSARARRAGTLPSRGRWTCRGAPHALRHRPHQRRRRGRRPGPAARPCRRAPGSARRRALRTRPRASITQGRAAHPAPRRRGRGSGRPAAAPSRSTSTSRSEAPPAAGRSAVAAAPAAPRAPGWCASTEDRSTSNHGDRREVVSTRTCTGPF